MEFQDEFNRLQQIITSDNHDIDDAQRDLARTAKNKLINDAVETVLDSMDKRSGAYENLITKLKAIVDGIKANQLATALESLDKWVTEVNEAADGG
nr:hypothetical protein [uncultured Desulfobacter sp.]